MTHSVNWMLYHGSTTPIAQALSLRAGMLSLQYEAGSLRYIRLGDIELVRQIYSAVRDQNWGTIAGRLENVTIQSAPDHFEIAFESIHQHAEIDFRWQGVITGTPDNTIQFRMRGQAHSTFKRNRIGFCVLHPMQCAGARCRVEQVDGTTLASHFPQSIAPHQPFKNIRAFQHEYAPHQWVEVQMEGDIFEMEDQRNWIDASFKTYCTPLTHPFPVTIEAGTSIEQSVTVRLLQPPAQIQSNAQESIIITPAKAQAVGLPKLGLGATTQPQTLNAQAIARLQALKLAHLRVEVRLSQADWQARLHHDAQQAQQIGVPLEVALHLPDDAVSALRAFVKQQIALGLNVVRYLIFREGEKSTRAEWVTRTREILGDGVPLFGGTDAFFTELNRERPPHEVLNGVVYSVNPQVHAFDTPSLTETLAVQGVTVESARAFSGAKPIHVSPVTLKMRWNPNATTLQTPANPNDFPTNADARQMSLFGAGWTLNSIKYLALGGAAGLTYYETHGYLGIMSTEIGSAFPDKFWDVPDGVYPMYHVFADVGEFVGGTLFPLQSANPLAVDGLALQDEKRLVYLIANLTAQPQTLALATEGRYRLRTLDALNAEAAMRTPELYRTQSAQHISSEAGHIHLNLTPFALIRLDREVL